MFEEFVRPGRARGGGRGGVRSNSVSVVFVVFVVITLLCIGVWASCGAKA